MGDNGRHFGDSIDNTELPHLLEHMTVELLARTNIAGDITCGRTYPTADSDRVFDIVFPCSDDVLITTALSSAEWIVEWAYNGGGEPEPDVDAIVSGIVGLVDSVSAPAEETVSQPAVSSGAAGDGATEVISGEPEYEDGPVGETPGEEASAEVAVEEEQFTLEFSPSEDPTPEEEAAATLAPEAAPAPAAEVAPEAVAAPAPEDGEAEADGIDEPVDDADDKDDAGADAPAQSDWDIPSVPKPKPIR
jgi:hypothetical protein